jgi:hypothetical protein
MPTDCPWPRASWLQSPSSQSSQVIGAKPAQERPTEDGEWGGCFGWRDEAEGEGFEPSIRLTTDIGFRACPAPRYLVHPVCGVESV